MAWVSGGMISTLAVNAALLPSGRILYFGGSDYNPNNHDKGEINHSNLYDCASGRIVPVNSRMSTDAFCCGHSLLPGGRLVVGGGTATYAIGAGPGIHHDHWPGIADAWIFEDRTSEWRKLADMHGGRWYLTLVTLADGRVLASSGHPSAGDRRHINNTPEVYAPEEDRWTLLEALGDEGRELIPHRDPGFQVQYPRMHVLPNGDVFFVTPLYEGAPTSLRYDPRAQRHVFVGGQSSDPAFLPAALVNGQNTTSVLLPFLRSQAYKASVLLCGLKQPLRIDLDDPDPRWRPTRPRTLPDAPVRYNLSAVILPTGDIFITGGVNAPDRRDQFGVLTPEIYHPETNDWETADADPAGIVRNYHSVALLMPDGRVWTAGSNHDGRNSRDGEDTHEPAIRIYEPWYHSKPRPDITACPPEMRYRRIPGDDFSFKIQTPQAATLNRVALLRAGSSTHAFNSDQRYVELDFQVTAANELSATPPGPGGIAPPGDYLLFILDAAGVPSKGAFVRLSDPEPGPPVHPPRVSQPFAIHNQDRRIELFVAGIDGALYHRWQTQPSGPFASWRSLGGNVSQPFAIQNQDGRIELFAVGADSALWHQWQVAPNGPFAGWRSLGGNVRQPFAIHNQDQRIEVFVIGADAALWHRWQTAPNGPFADWHSLGGNASHPFAIQNQDQRIEVLAVGSDGALWHRWQTAPNGPFADWHSLGGKVNQVFAIHNQDGRIEILAIGSDSAVWHRWQTAPNGPFADWHSLEGRVREIFAIRDLDGRIELFASGGDGALWRRRQISPNGPFAAWESLGGSVSQPFAITNQDGRVEVFVVGGDGAIWHRWQTSPGGPFADWHQLS